MSEENSKENENSGQSGIDTERFSNFQEEINRKLGNTNSQVEQLINSQKELMQYLSQPKSQDKSESIDSISELLYTDPDKALKLVEERATKRVEEKLNSQNQATQAQQQKAQRVLSQLSQKYPELNDSNSELSQKAVQIFESFSEEDKANQAVAYRAAINEAAAELGIRDAKSRKSKSDDEDYGDFIVGGSGSKRPRTGKKPKISSETVAFAEAMGLNIEDKEVLKRLANRSQRDWGKYR